jgi:hypothetical protein
MTIDGATDTAVFQAHVRAVLVPRSKVKAVKALLRTAEARTADQLQHAIAQALKRGTPHDAARWFAACGYSII